MSDIGYIFDLERIIRKYLVLMESWLRNDILVLFIEFFRVHTNQRSASRYFSLSLLKLHILLPSICCLWNKQSFLLPPPFSFFLFACMHKVGFISYKTKMPVFSQAMMWNQWPCGHMAQNTKFWSHGWNFRVSKSNACEHDT